MKSDLDGRRTRATEVLSFNCVGRKLESNYVMKLSRQIIETEWPVTGVQFVKTTPGKDKRITVYVKSNKGECIFKIAHRKKTEKILKKDTTVLRFLQKKKFKASPGILETRNGHLYKRINDRLVYAMEYIHGITPKSSPKVWHELGKVVASLHLIKPPQSLRSAFTVASQRAKMLKLAGRFKVESRYIDIVKKLPNLAMLPQSMIHTDVAVNNVIQKPDGSLVLVDWDDAGKGPSVLDIGFVLTSFLTSKLKFESAKAIAFFTGYRSVRKMPEVEKRFAVDAGLLFGLSYSIHERRGFDPGYWRWTQYVAAHRDIFEKVLKSTK